MNLGYLQKMILEHMEVYFNLPGAKHRNYKGVWYVPYEEIIVWELTMRLFPKIEIDRRRTFMVGRSSYSDEFTNTMDKVRQSLQRLEKKGLVERVRIHIPSDREASHLSRIKFGWKLV